MKLLPLVLALAFVAAGTAQGRSRAACSWGATTSNVGCLAPYTHCTKAREAAYRRHAYSCVAGNLQYDYSQLRRRPVRQPACTLTSQQGTLKRNGFGSVPAWGSPASPFMPERSLVAPVEYDPGAYAEYGLFKAMWAIDPRYVGQSAKREAFLDLVDEFVNFQDLIAGLARHPEPLVADVVECQRHRAPRVSRWNFRWGRAPHPPYRTQFGLGAQPSEYDGEKS